MGRSDLTYADLQHLDSVYVQSWSLMWDLRILLQTPQVVFARRGALPPILRAVRCVIEGRTFTTIDAVGAAVTDSGAVLLTGTEGFMVRAIVSYLRETRHHISSLIGRQSKIPLDGWDASYLPGSAHR